MQTEKVTTFSSGAQSSSNKAGYWMIPFVVLRAVAQRFDLGAKKYDAHNWKRGSKDPEFMRDRFNHMFEHMMKFKEGGDAEDNQEASIIAVLINAVFLTYWTIMYPVKVMEAFPTEATTEPPTRLPKTDLEKLKVAAHKVPVIVSEEADKTPRRSAVAFQPVLPKVEVETDDNGDLIIPVSPGKTTLPGPVGNQQYC